MNHYKVIICIPSGEIITQCVTYADNFAEAGEQVFGMVINTPGEYHVSVTPFGTETIFKFNITQGFERLQKVGPLPPGEDVQPDEDKSEQP